MTQSRLVYSTETGAICPKCESPVKSCRCRKSKGAQPTGSGDGIVRVARERKGRRGKTVTTIQGLNVAPDALGQVARQLKRMCGTGGAVKGGIIEIQGDHRTAICDRLRNDGYRVKLTGG